MRIRALKTFTHPAEIGMIVLNAAKGKAKAGEAELPDEVAQAYVDAGMAEKVKTAGESAGAANQPGDDLKALRAEYKAKSGRSPYQGWSADDLRMKLAAIYHANQPGEIQPVEGQAALVLVTVDEDGKHVVSAPWLDATEAYDDAELADVRQAEIREEGPPDGWKPEEDIAP